MNTKIKKMFKYKKLFFAALFILLLSIVQLPVRKVISQKIADRGNHYFNGGEYDVDKASALYEKAAIIYSNNWLAHYQLGRIGLVRGDFNQGISEINKALAIDPENKRAYYVRGLLNGYRGNYAGAEKDLQAFVAWASDGKIGWAGYVDLSWAYINNNKFEEAIATANNALSIFPENAWLYANKGLAQYKLGRYDEAKADLETAKSLADKISPDSWKKAYPGNNPADAEKGVEEIKAAIGYNLKLAYKMAGNENEADELEINSADLASLSKYSGKSDLADGIILSACGESYNACSGYTCQSIGCDSHWGTCLSSSCSSNGDCCTPNGCQNWTCREDTCDNGCGSNVQGTVVCTSSCDDGEKCGWRWGGYFRSQIKIGCNYKGAWCDSWNYSYGCTNNDLYSNSSWWQQVECCGNSDCPWQHGGNSNWYCSSYKCYCDLNACEKITCRDYQCNDSCGGWPWGQVICYNSCDNGEVCSYYAAWGGFYRRQVKVTCSSDKGASCDSYNYSYYCPNNWLYKDESWNKKEECCENKDCPPLHGNNPNFTCDRIGNDNVCVCHPNDPDCDERTCNNRNCYDGCNIIPGTKSCCDPDPNKCDESPWLEIRQETCKPANAGDGGSLDECGGYSCDGLKDCQGWVERKRQN